MALTSGYSAKVALKMVVNGHELSLSHVGPDGVIVRDDCDPIAPCHAQIIIQVDESEEIIDVFLPNGVAGPNQRIQYI